MLWLLALAVVVAAGETEDEPIAARRVIPPPERMPVPKRATVVDLGEEAEPGIRLWGESSTDTEATWVPGYQKSLGCKKFRWGFCTQQWFDHMDEEAKKQGAAGIKVLEFVEKAMWWIVRFYSVQAAEIARWVMRNFCFRFSFPMRKYEAVNGWTGYAIHIQTDTRLYPPAHPLQPRSGWKRVWMRMGPNWTRNEQTVTVFWPASEPGGPIVQEIVNGYQLRGMLRMDSDVTGAMDVRSLAHSNGICDKAHWWPARKSKAKPEF